MRQASSEADIDVLVSMMRELYAHDGVEFDEARSRGALRELMGAAEHGLVLIIECDGAVAGYIVLTYGFSIEIWRTARFH